MRLFGLIGFPLAQSFSKKYFDQKFEKEGITDGRFENFPLASITEFPGLLHTHPDLRGLAVTIPYKQSVLEYLNSTSDIPEGLNACNCIRIQDGILTGYNTDYIGFEKSFTPMLKSHHRRALVLGNGGATAAVVFVLRKAGIPYSIVSRKLHDDSAFTYDELNESIIKEHAIIINTTPLGMFPLIEECPDIPYHFLTADHLLYDLVYNPEKTRFLSNGEARGARIVNGRKMLVLQAEENWRIWNV